ncbi:MAG: hypothetical protein CSA76_05415 [Spirochaetales bacterium]|nr:MAG: hypothetical protein CSA76_05415 [Spirochaetales bacterium]
MEKHSRQIFIVHPDTARRESLVGHLRRKEYETYGLNLNEAAVLNYEGESVLFVFDTAAQDMELLTRSLAQAEYSPRIVGCGEEEPFSSEKELINYLQTIGAHGNRAYVRFGSQYASIATFESYVGERRFAGIVHDISSAALSASFRPQPEDLSYLEMDSICVNLPGYRANLPGSITGKRISGRQAAYIFHFNSAAESSLQKELRSFIYTSLKMKLTRDI